MRLEFIDVPDEASSTTGDKNDHQKGLNPGPNNSNNSSNNTNNGGNNAQQDSPTRSRRKIVKQKPSSHANGGAANTSSASGKAARTASEADPNNQSTISAAFITTTIAGKRRVLSAAALGSEGDLNWLFDELSNEVQTFYKKENKRVEYEATNPFVQELDPQLHHKLPPPPGPPQL